MSKRTLERQQQRDIKLSELLKTGKVVRVHYEDRKDKKAQPNRKCAATTPKEEMAKRQETIENVTKV